MSACMPNPIPQEAGCLARRITDHGTTWIWHVTYWSLGRAWQATVQCGSQPLLDGIEDYFLEHPDRWSAVAPTSTTSS